MRYFLLCTLLLGMIGVGPARADQVEALCATNPAFSPKVMLAVVEAQLEHDHDPSLDADTPENLANRASAQGISECAATLRADPIAATALTGLKDDEVQTGWDAFNTTCADHKASMGACITAELQSARALNRMVKKNEPPGAKALVQACALIMVSDPAMAEWRQCVDQGLAVHASDDDAKRCKVSATWHVAKTGAEAGGILTACLRQK
jgi:hypothetical protein